MSNIVPVKQAPLAGLAGYGGGVPGLFLHSGTASELSLEKSVRFNDNDSAYLGKTLSSNGNRRTYTISLWTKRGNLGKSFQPFIANPNSSGVQGLYFDFSSDYLNIQEYTGGLIWAWQSAAVYRDPNAWYHVVAAIDTTQATASNRIKMYINGVQVTDYYSGYPTWPTQNLETNFNNNTFHAIGRLGSVTTGDYYFDGYMADFYFIDGQQLDPTSFGAFDDSGVWQASKFTGTFGTNGFHLFDFANESTVGHDASGNENDWTAYNINSGTTYSGNVTATASPSGASMIIKAVGSTVTGTFNASGGTGGNINYYSSNDGLTWTRLGTSTGQSSSYTAKFLSMGGGSNNTRQFTATSGSFEYSVAGSASLDSSSSTVTVGQAQLFDNPNLDILFDVPTNGTQSGTGAGGEVSANYCTLNPLDKATVAVLSDGNLRTNSSSTGAIRGTFKYPKTGKWYYEVQPLDDSQYNTGYFHVGIATANANLNTNPGYDATNEFTYWQNGSKTGNASYGASFTAGDIVGVAFDADAGSLTFYKNGVSQGVNSTGLTGEYFPYAPTWNYNAAYNFGQRPFAFPVSNYLPLSTKNLPTPAIADGSDYFDTTLYTGNGANSRTISGLGFSPDFLWVKDRGNTAGDFSHRLMDAVRGAGIALSSNSTAAERDNSAQSGGGVETFTSDGFTIEQGTSNNNNQNNNNSAYVAWAWNAGTSTASNTDGSVTSSVRANQTAGFSIITFTAPSSSTASYSVGHGLNVAPEFWLWKSRSATGSWQAYFTVLGSSSNRLNLDSTGAVSSSYPGSATNSIINLSDGPTAAWGGTNVIYAFAPVAGYSAFGSYTGNGSTDGAFVYTGFTPAFILLKRTDSGIRTWEIHDTARSPGNVSENNLIPNVSNAESSGSARLDILSNGFKLRTTSNGINNGNIIYAAFAEHPFKTARAR